MSDRERGKGERWRSCGVAGFTWCGEAVRSLGCALVEAAVAEVQDSHEVLLPLQPAACIHVILYACICQTPVQTYVICGLTVGRQMHSFRSNSTDCSRFKTGHKKACSHVRARAAWDSAWGRGRGTCQGMQSSGLSPAMRASSRSFVPRSRCTTSCSTMR